MPEWCRDFFIYPWDNPGATVHMYLTIFIFSILYLNLVKPLVSQSVPGVFWEKAGAIDLMFLY